MTCTENLKIEKSIKFIFSRGGFSKNLFSSIVFASSYFTLQPWQGTVLFTSIRYHNNQLLRYLGVWEPLHLLLNRAYKMGTDNFYMQLTSCFPYFYLSYPLSSIFPPVFSSLLHTSAVFLWRVWILHMGKWNNRLLKFSLSHTHD